MNARRTCTTVSRTSHYYDDEDDKRKGLSLYLVHLKNLYEVLDTVHVGDWKVEGERVNGEQLGGPVN